MLIDPVIVVAQIVNFLILVILLKRFLYGPIVNAMEQREQKIATRLQEAEMQATDAQREAELYRQKQQEFEAQRQELLNLAQQEIERERQVLMAKARAEVDATRVQWYETLDREKQAFLRELQQNASQQITAISRHVLGDLANADLEAQIVETFIDRLHHLDASQLEMMRFSSSRDRKREVAIRTVFAVAPETRSRLARAIEEQIGTEVEVAFETREEAICGIELRDRDYKLSWNLEHYLQELETEMERALARQIPS